MTMLPCATPPTVTDVRLEFDASAADPPAIPHKSVMTASGTKILAKPLFNVTPPTLKCGAPTLKLNSFVVVLYDGNGSKYCPLVAMNPLVNFDAKDAGAAFIGSKPASRNAE